MEEFDSGKLTECCDLLNTISNYPDNKKCFDCCDNYSPRYLCTTFSTFVCSCCANIHHKEFGHTIKVLSVFSFTVNEIYVLKGTGNKVAADKWLARWRSDLYMEPDPTSPTYKEDARKYMKAKYIEKRWVKVPPALPIPPGGIKREGVENEPRGYDDVSPRKVIPDGAVPADLPPVAQQHEEKNVTHFALRDPYTATPVMYVPQPMYIPVGVPQMQMAVGPYGYTYVAQPDGSKMPPPPPPPPPPAYHTYGTLYTYPYDNMHCFPPPILSENVSWPGAHVSQKRPVATVMQPLRDSQQLTSIEELPTGPPGAIFRSVSDNSIVTHYIVQHPATIQREPSSHCIEYVTPIQETKQLHFTPPEQANSETKQQQNTQQASVLNNRSETKTGSTPKSGSKLKLGGFMDKVTGFISKNLGTS